MMVPSRVTLMLPEPSFHTTARANVRHVAASTDADLLPNRCVSLSRVLSEPVARAIVFAMSILPSLACRPDPLLIDEGINAGAILTPPFDEAAHHIRVPPLRMSAFPTPFS